jgi:hypothetical protein
MWDWLSAGNAGYLAMNKKAAPQSVRYPTVLGDVACGDGDPVRVCVEMSSASDLW